MGFASNLCTSNLGARRRRLVLEFSLPQGELVGIAGPLPKHSGKPGGGWTIALMGYWKLEG